MWYRFAQNNPKTVWKNTPNGEGLLLQSPMLENGYKSYPDILINFKTDKYTDSLRPFSKEISQEEITNILLEIQNQLAKYPEGFLSKSLGNNFVINMFLEFKGKVAGEYMQETKNIYISKKYIAFALDHEIGHALDFTRFPLNNEHYNWPDFDLFKQKNKGGTYMSPSKYGKTNNLEAFAEAYKILMQKGLDYRLPNNSEENIDKNRLFDYTVEFLKSKNLTKLNTPQLSRPAKDLPKDTKNLTDMRVSTLIGGFQNAIDKFQGDKQKYGTELLNDKQKIADIVAFLNKTRTEFYVAPITEDEITAATSYMKQQVDKKGVNQRQVFQKESPNFDTNTKIKVNIIPQNILNEINKYDITMLPKSNAYIIIRKATKKPATEQEKTNLINIVTKSKWQNLVEISQEDLNKFNLIKSILSLKISKDSGQDIIYAFYEYLVESIFPNTKLKNPEDFLFFDFKLTSQGYVLDQSALEKQFNYVLSLYQKRQGEMPQDLLNQVRTEVFRLINIYAEKYKKLLDYKEKDPKNPLPFGYIGRQIGKVLNPTNYLDLAIKAVDKIVTRKGVPRANKTNEMFMKLYNNDLLNADQKQKLLDYYRLKQNSLKK